ncbi:hypothetical protein D9619_006139 [Psilocybe cf. subviscida]|uniref:Condensin complex subunit 2 n=1 Tax=Psilocybe cf. subviscida TaxID=2480587 RepID=A0A8H5B5A5_9AGAR|nr:hypothetical protein D9619_006139 [Psilocybe cf. subviscida]
MPPSRRHTEQPAQENDTDPESEQETPRPHKSHLRKRLSEVYNPDNDASVTSDNGARAPLRTVNINDDAAEKRRRRKSTKPVAVAENALAGPSGANDAEPRKKQQLNAVAPEPIEVPLILNGEKYEEWMKMATDNKINAANSWQTALIDYFHDMTLLRNLDDNSINFQRASCTLEGCVKIWTSRVDSVGTETGKLLNNLESGSRFDEDHDSDNPDADPGQARRKKNRAGAATLATNPDKIKQKKPDLEFAVDPLFRKTCADFDEGGAGGLLMNHLSLGIGSEGCMRVIFDGSDVMRQNEEEEVVVDEPPSEIDLKDLRQKFFPDLSELEGRGITSTLTDFSWGNNALVLDDSTFFQDDSPPPDDNDDYENEMPLDHFGGGQDGPAPVEDFFEGPEAVDNDYNGDLAGNYDDDNHSNAGSIEAGADEENGRPGQFVPFDPRRMPSGRDMMMAMVDGEDGTLDYFDQKFRTNWAGPEHWKIRRNIRKPEGEAAGAKPAKRQKKEAVKIDFLTPADKDLKALTAELFAPPSKGMTINLPGTGRDTKKGRKKKEKKNDHRLPDDMHFSSKQLVTLFLKPKFMLKMRGKRVRMNEGEVDEQFWAQAAAGGNQGGNDDDDGNEPAPFSTQFFHEDDGFDDDGGFDGLDADRSVLPGEDAGEQDLIAATQGQARRARPEAVNYARKAKRVDVRKLKENIWKGLDIVIKKESDGDEETMDVDDDEAVQPTDPNESRQFSQVITGLQRSYPRDKMEEISTSFCFICLLHLANEQGLKLETATADLARLQVADDAGEVRDDDDIGVDGDEPAPDEKKIGNIWDIKIYRDPNATQSA